MFNSKDETREMHVKMMALKVNVHLGMPFKFLLLSKDFFKFVEYLYHLVIVMYR